MSTPSTPGRHRKAPVLHLFGQRIKRTTLMVMAISSVAGAAGIAEIATPDTASATVLPTSSGGDATAVLAASSTTITELLDSPVLSVSARANVEELVEQTNSIALEVNSRINDLHSLNGQAIREVTREQSDRATAHAEVAAAQVVIEEQTREAARQPQILTVAEHKPVENVYAQVDSAVAYAQERVEIREAQAQKAAQTAAREAEVAAQAVSQAANQAVAQVSSAAGGSSSTSSEIIGAVARPTSGVFTSGFGPRWGSMHSGIDIAAPIGTPIYAVMDGTVINSGPASGYGNWIRIRHDDGSISVYGHMSSLGVSVGQRVAAGQYIAGMGSEGYSTGSHLHFEIHPGGAGAVDPVGWFSQRGIYF